MIQVSELTRYFGEYCAVDQLSFDVKEGDILGFLGPNGAGKSTTMKMLTGFLTASSGDIIINEKNLLEYPVEIKQSIGYLPEGAPSYQDMSVFDFLVFIGEMRGYSGDALIQRLATVIAQVELSEVLYKKIETLSKGFKRRVGIAQAIFHDPKILILDEPTDGLDPNQKHQVRQLIANMSRDKIIIISTHILEEVAAVCNRAMIIAHGKKLFDGTPDELLQRSKLHNAIQLSTEQTIDIEWLKELKGVESVETLGDNNWLLLGSGRETLVPLTALLADKNIEVNSLELHSGKLDEVFREMTRAA